MSDAPDKDSKTEQPTEKKISDALEKGNVAFSREATMLASLAGLLVAMVYLTRERAPGLVEALQLLLDHPGAFALESGSDASELLLSISFGVGVFVIPIVLTIGLASIFAGMAQNAPRLVLERVRPRWSRVSPGAGMKRIFGAQAFFEFAKSLAKFIVIGSVCAFLLESQRRAAVDAMFSDPTQIPGQILAMAVRLVSAVCVAMVILVVLDLVRTRLNWRGELRMTKHEIKEEMKQAEGNPLVKSRLRSLARDRARRRMISAVPKATVIIANPTHYAIALKYDREKGGAPLVLAKGVDLIALRIREVAAQHSVPIVEDRALARALYDAVEVDQWIPPEFYRAVAKILFYLHSRGAYAAR